MAHQGYYVPQENSEKPPPIFVGGLPRECFDDELKQFAEGYFGPVAKAIVKMDFSTGRSRGFGFIEFEEHKGFNDILAADPSTLVIMDKQVEVRQFEKGAKPKNKLDFSDPPTEEELTCFVGALPQVCDDAMLAEYCSHFGPVESASVKMDPETDRSRGFAFVKFATPDGVRGIVESYYENMIDDKWIDVKQVGDKGKGKGGDKGGKGKSYGGGKGGYQPDYNKGGGYGKGYGKGGGGQGGGYGKSSDKGYGKGGGGKSNDKGFGKKMDKGYGKGGDKGGKGKGGGKKGGNQQDSWGGPQKRAAPY